MDITPTLEGLNAAQRSAVISPAAVLQILAPPGSGKTKTLTARVAYLLSHYGYKPWNILCLTFTKKSAQEMKERVTKLVGDGMGSKLVLGTFHSVCHRYLNAYGHLIGLRKGFQIADSSDSIAIITRITKRLRLNIDPKAARSRISSSKARGVGCADLAARPEKKKNIDQQEFVSVFEAYEAELATSNLLDYDDLLLRCVNLLREHPNCVSNVEVVLIDEFQDTNLVQFDLMRLFAARNHRVTTVGDPDQSIYGWRSAEVKNLKRMQSLFPDTLVLHLEDNYRSSGAILLAALEVIQQDESRPAKPLLPTHCPGTVPVLRRLPSAAIEAGWIVSEIKRSIALTGNLLNFDDYAILLRSASLSRQIESAMGKAGIPYRMVGGFRFFDRTEIKVLLDYLRVISQPDNSDALARIINVPSRRVGDSTIKALLEEAAAKGSTLWNTVRGIIQGQITSNTKISKVAEQGLGSLINIVLSAKKKMLDPINPCLPQQLLEYVLKKLEFKEYLEKIHSEDYEVRWANVEELVAQASDCSVAMQDIRTADDEELLPQIEGLPQNISNNAEEALSKFLANVALSTELQRDEDVDEETGPQAKVTISTIHAAKGLEWPVVFIPAAYEGSIPHSRAEDGDEERRLLYVAMTRAQALLYMSCPTKNSMREDTKLSSFLSPKKICSYLTNKGPSLRPGIVQDIARIVRRVCPSDSVLVSAINKVERIEDDLWPLNGEEDPEAVQVRWDNNGSANDDYSMKRRKYTRDDADSSTAQHQSYRKSSATALECSSIHITMQNSSSFTIAPHISGFISATTQMQNMKQESEPKICREAQDERRIAKQLKTGKADRIKKSDPCQAGLMKYWREKRVDGEESASSMTDEQSSIVDDLGTRRRSCYQDRASSRLAEPARDTTTLTENAMDLGLGTEARPRNAMSAIPQPLSHHVIRPLVNKSRPKYTADDESCSTKAYVFLSSSPPREEDVIDQAQRDSSQVMSSNSPVKTIATGAQSSKERSGIRPASTYHRTSMAEIQSNGIPPRRTLGVRRSMVGWSVGGSHSFSKPRMTGL